MAEDYTSSLFRLNHVAVPSQVPAIESCQPGSPLLLVLGLTLVLRVRRHKTFRFASGEGRPLFVCSFAYRKKSPAVLTCGRYLWCFRFTGLMTY